MLNPTRYNAVERMVDANVANGLGDKPAFVDPTRSLTYGPLQRATNLVAGVLTGLGLEQENRIALLMPDTVDFPAVFWGAIRAGIVPVCLNTMLTTDQYRYMLSDSRAKALVVAAPLLPLVQPLLGELPFLRHVIAVGGGADTPCPDLHALMDQASPEFVTADTHPDETAFWIYSSGSTGAPKGVRHIHSSPAFVADNYGRGILDIRATDIGFSVAKLFFAYGHGASMACPMAVGATSILLPDRPTPAVVMQMLRTHRPTLFFGVPTLYAAMLADPDCRPENGSDRLRLCVSAGEALPTQVAQDWQARFGVPIIDGVGSTEMLHPFVSNRPGDIRPGTSGKVVPGYRLRLVDDWGRDQPDGEIGELLVSGGSMGDGYWNQRARSQATFAGEWLHTGDKYFRDPDGYYHYCGRTDDMFKVGGRWVSPFEVEQALASHPAVLEAAVVACEDADRLIKPKAFVVLNRGADTEGLFDSLKEHVKTAIGVWKYPRWIELVDDLPKTATGKIQRYKLRCAPPGEPCTCPEDEAETPTQTPHEDGVMNA
jgi:4-hydroxybenzoate-CoA ligase